MQTKFRWLIRIGIVSGILLLGIYLKERNFFRPVKTESRNIDSVKVYYGNAYHTIYINDSLSFAGERIPVRDSLVRKHLKYLLTVNAEWFPKAYYTLQHYPDVIDTVKKRLTRMGVPADFRYIAFNESHFQNITSDNGTVGVWQLESTTARYFGLRVDSVIDERNSITRSTYAAAHYINYLHSLYGNWILSVAAYNTGPGVVNYNMQYLKVKNMDDFFCNYYLSGYTMRIIMFKVIFDNAAIQLKNDKSIESKLNS